MEKPFSAYVGDDPYVFVCYAHADDQVVYPEIEWLNQQGVNVWYDEGISAGRIWRAEVGNAIKNASRILFYISRSSLASDHCSREINFALDELREVIPIYLEDIALTTDLQVGLSSVQALHRDQDPRYRDHLLGAAAGSSRSTRTPSALPTQPSRRVPMALAFVTGLAMIMSVAWWYLAPRQGEQSEEVVNLVIEPFVLESESALGLEYEIQRVLSGSLGLIIRVSDGSAIQADYILRGAVQNDELTAQLVSQDGESIASWRINVTNELSKATRTLARDLLVSLGRTHDELPQLDEEIPQRTFRTYLRAMSMLRGSHSVETLNMALGGFSQVIGDAPRYAPAHAGLCSTYLGLYLEHKEESNIQLAEIHCHRALTLGGQDPTVHNALGMLYRETGQAQKGVDSYSRSLELAPYSSDAMRGLAESLSRTGANAEAEKWYQEAIKVEPSHWENYHALGIHQISLGYSGLAIETFQTAFALAPDEPTILNNIGVAHFMAGEYKQAVVYWRQAVEQQPSASIYANLGTSYFFQRDFKSAAEMYIEAHKQAPKDHRYLGLAAEAYYVSSQDEHKAYFRRAIPLALAQLDIDPNDDTTFANIGSYYAGLGDEENAKVFIERAMSKGSQNVDVVYYVTISYSRLGDIKMASEMLDNLITLGYERKLLDLDANFDVLLDVMKEKSNQQVTAD